MNISPNLQLINKYWQLLEQHKNDEVQMGYFADMLIKNKSSLAKYRRKIVLFLKKIDYVDPLFNGEIGVGDIKVDGVTCCWLWNACKNNLGYGKFCLTGIKPYRMVNSHRFMLFLVDPDFKLDSELDALHRCDNPGCCNPNHIWPGTDQDNSIDRNNKNRQFHTNGSNHGRAKLTDDQVWAIFYDIRVQEVIAVEYSITNAAVSNIKRGERKLTDPTKSLPKNHQNKIISLQGKHIKITKEIAEEIPKLYATDKYTYKELSIKFGVNPKTIWNIINGKFLKRFN